MVQIFIKTDNGKTITVDVQAADTIYMNGDQCIVIHTAEDSDDKGKAASSDDICGDCGEYGTQCMCKWARTGAYQSEDDESATDITLTKYVPPLVIPPSGLFNTQEYS